MPSVPRFVFKIWLSLYLTENYLFGSINQFFDREICSKILKDIFLLSATAVGLKANSRLRGNFHLVVVYKILWIKKTHEYVVIMVLLQLGPKMLIGLLVNVSSSEQITSVDCLNKTLRGSDWLRFNLWSLIIVSQFVYQAKSSGENVFKELFWAILKPKEYQLSEKREVYCILIKILNSSLTRDKFVYFNFLSV